MDFSSSGLHTALIYILVVVVSITVHEFAHAISADRLGDDTPRRQGRITLLPTEHFDPLGFLMLCFLAFGGVGLGWGKPVQVNPGALRHPRRDMIIIAAAGPFSNLLIATLFGLVVRLIYSSLWDQSGHPNLTGELVFSFVQINLSLMFFNLIPIPPLDGSKVLSNLLPFEQSVRYDRVMGQYGFMILIGLLFFGRTFLWEMLNPPISMMATLLTGQQMGHS